VEDKELSLGWHYRLADPEFGAWLANELVSALDRLLAGTELSVIHGRKVVEVHFAWANKGEVAASLRPRSPRGRFILAIGDDRTDEDMFARLPASAWTVRVGRGPTRARSSVRGPEATLGLLAMLAESQPTEGGTG
jgi:trehalose 6-phosphate synthase/phosphatase